MGNKQTAVEWLIEELGEYFPNEIGGIHLMVAKAKAMEKEQIEMAFSRSYLIGLLEVNYDDVNREAENYYNETYGK